MADALKGIVIGILLTGLVVAAFAFGLVRPQWPFGLGDVLPRDLARVDATMKADEATITRIEPIALDCRTRIHAVVPVEGRRTHSLAGLTYRTDVVRLTARGDVDTCVNAADVVVEEDDEDGTFRVTIPGQAIRYVRPRVDTVATAESVSYDEGWIGELTGLLPGVDDSDPLMPGAYAFAQQVIGGSACMEQAFEVTRQIIEQAYIDQLTVQGAPLGTVEVVIGEPDLTQHPLPPTIAGVSYDVDGGVRCQIAPGARDGVSPSWEELRPGS